MESQAITVFLDANILFSASLPGSRLRVFLDELAGRADLTTNEYAHAEAARNLGNKQPTHLDALRELMRKCTLRPTARINLQSVELAEKDRPILAGAVAAEADVLLTGDRRDFGHLFGKEACGVTILNVAGLLEWLRERDIIA